MAHDRLHEPMTNESSAQLSKTWTAQYIAPDTAYPDEPSEIIPTGWYVFGDAHNKGTDTVVHIEHAFDSNGDEADGRLAHAIANALNNTAHTH